MKNKLWLVSFAGGLLCGLSWFDKATGLIIITALVPFLYILHHSVQEKVPGSLIFIRLLPGFLLFNLLTISWLRNATVAGTFYVLLANTFLMSAVFWLASVIYKRSNPFLGYTSLITFWIILEHINSKVSLLTPWLNLGNTLGNEILFIQWYDTTGVPGGSLWILLCNLSLLYIILGIKERGKLSFQRISVFIILFFLPSGISAAKFLKSEHHGSRSEFLIVQPNIDPYNEKFDGIPFDIQLSNMLKLIDDNISDSTDWAILPETAIDDPFYEEGVKDNKYYLMIDSLLACYPGLSVITGATTMRLFHHSDRDLPEHARRIDSSRVYYEVYNSAMQVNPDSDVNFYHKSKLVPGIEQKIRSLPKFVSERIIPDLGGTMTGYSPQDERTVFLHHNGISAAAPVICYESVFGEFVTEYTRKGANVLVIITNDGWWENTAGYRQHLMFARIRAIENRRPVARAANTGISCFIDTKGRILEKSGWWEEAVLTHSLELSNELSFYSQNGDFISRYISVFGVFLLIIAFIGAPLRKLRDNQKF